MKKALSLTLAAIMLAGNLTFSANAAEKKLYSNNPVPIATVAERKSFRDTAPVLKGKISDGWYSNYVELSWKTVDHALYYQVFKKTVNDKKFMKIATIFDESYFDYYNNTSDVSYVVRAVTYDFSDKIVNSELSNTYTLKAETKKSTNNNSSGTSVGEGCAAEDDEIYEEADYDYADDCEMVCTGEGDSIDDYAEPEYYNTEEYAKSDESSFVKAAKKPKSTFSADVDTAAYANLRRFINNNQSIPTSAIRIEEMLNYFDYNYPAPTGNEPFSVTTELSDCPWNKKAQLMLVGIQGKDIEESKLPASNLVFLVDVSGSMDTRDKLPLVKEALNNLTETLGENDRLSIVIYSGSERVILEGANGNHKNAAKSVIDLLDADGSTNGESGINMAYQLAQKYFIKGGNNRIIMCTDGDLNVGVQSESALTKLIEEKRKTGVYFSILGFGEENIKDNKMKALASNGNGNYNYIDSAIEANKVLVEEKRGTLFTIADDVKIQVEFNAGYVAEYRLIGYDYRKLKDKDFANDKKDAAEIGAGHTVTAIYEIIPTSNDTSKYLSTNTMATVNIRYKEPSKSTSKLITKMVRTDDYSATMSSNMKFAAGVSEVGMVLKESEFKGTSSLKSARSLLSGYKNSSDPYKKEFYELLEKLIKNYKY